MADSNESTQKLSTLAAALISRHALASRLGVQFGGDRDLYAVLGYKPSLSYTDYEAMYSRGDIARRIVDAPAQATWRRPPIIENDADPNQFSDFERAWAKLVHRLQIFHYLERVDRLAGIGEYGALMIGAADARSIDDLQRPIRRLRGPDDILYLSPFTQKTADIETYDADPSSPRFGLPEFYRITVGAAVDDATPQNPRGSNETKIRVHWSRIIHVAEDLGEDDVLGTPRLHAVYNRLMDIEKIAGGSAEIFWQAAKRIMVLEAKDDWEANDTNDDLTNNMDELVHGLRRVIDTQGYHIKTLDPTEVKPREAFSVAVSLIASATGIPQRILVGSEQGKLASEQDEANWNARITDRQSNYASAIIRDLIDRLVRVNALPDPSGEVSIVWPSLFELTDKERAQVGILRSRAIEAYIGKGGINVAFSQQVVPVSEFRREILGIRSVRPEFDSTDSDETIEGPAPQPQQPPGDDDEPDESSEDE